MTFKEEHIDLFDRYLRNQLEPAEIADFNKRLQEDPEFSKAFHQYQLLTEGVREFGRSQLKNFLKENAHTLQVTKPIQPRRIFLVAASIVLIIGVLAIIKLSVKPLQENNLAIQNAPEESVSSSEVSPPEITAPNKSEPEKAPAFKEMTAVEKEMALDDAPPPRSEMLAKDIGTLDISENTQVYRAEDIDYKVLSDTKIKDTILTPVLLSLNVDNFSNIEIDMNTNADAKKQSSLPYNVYSGSNAPAPKAATTKNRSKSKEANQSASADTATEKKLSKSVKVPVPNTTNINVQYWKSPINFTGYTYMNNTVQIFGFEPGSCTLYTINNQLYLRHLNQVYVINTCEKSCPMKLATDSEIIKLILSH